MIFTVFVFVPQFFHEKLPFFAGADRCGSRQPTCHHFRERGPFGNCFMQIPRSHIPKWVYLNVTNHQDVLEWVDFPASLCVGSYILLVCFAVQCRASLHSLFVFCNRFWDLIFDKHRIIQILLEVIFINDKEGLAVVQQSTVHWWSMLYNIVQRYCKLSSVSSEYGHRSTQQVIKDLTICVRFFRIVSEKPKRVSWRSSVPEASEISNAFIVH